MKIGKKILLILVIIGLTLPGISAFQIDKNINDNDSKINSLGSEYKGYLRVYIAEIESRWNMENGAPYKYAFMDFVENSPVEIAYLDTYEETYSWQGDIDLNNLIVLAAVFNEGSIKNYADPPTGNPFDAHMVDASAGVHPGETYTNVKNEDYTHTVFCEIGTASWCPSCPALANEVKKVYESGDFPFFFIEMVVDKSSQANSRMGDYNLKWLPTGFYDGGIDVVVGGGHGSIYHENLIRQAGKRDVHDLYLTLSAEATGDNSISIDISITNNEELPNSAPNNPTITGPESGKPGETYQYEISTVDPENDNVYYMIDWGNGEITDWLGPYESGETITQEYSWSEEGTYVIKVKSKDFEGLETDWTWLKVSMPKTMIKFDFIGGKLKDYPILFRIFNLLKY